VYFRAVGLEATTAAPKSSTAARLASSSAECRPLRSANHARSTRQAQASDQDPRSKFRAKPSDLGRGLRGAPLRGGGGRRAARRGARGRRLQATLALGRQICGDRFTFTSAQLVQRSGRACAQRCAPGGCACAAQRQPAPTFVARDPRDGGFHCPGRRPPFLAANRPSRP
jgi:hypothetical protein